MSENLQAIVGAVYKYLADPQLGAALFWLIAREKDQPISMRELGRSICVTHKKADKIFKHFLADGLIKIHGPVMVPSWSNGTQKHNVTICYDDIFKKCSMVPSWSQSGSINGSNDLKTKSPCDVGTVTKMPKQAKPKKQYAPGEDVRKFIAAYCVAYKSKFSENPIINGKENGSARNLVTDLGVEKSIKLVAAYLKMNDQWFIKTGYKLYTMYESLNKISMFAESGRFVSSIEAHQAERTSHNLAVRDSVIEYYHQKNEGRTADAGF